MPNFFIPQSQIGVSIVDGEPDEVIMELELQWDGNPKIVLDIKTRVGISLPIEVPAASTLSSITLTLSHLLCFQF